MLRINKKHLILVLLVFFIFTHKVNASLEITEIMYDPDGSDTNREWVKLYNNGVDTITILSGRSNSSWRFSDDTEGKELHLINDQLIINPGSFAVLASNKENFITEYSDFDGPVADTSMSLSNKSGIIRIWDGSEPRQLVVSKEYNSSTSEENSQSDSDNTDNSPNISSQISSSSSSSNDEEQKVYKITTKIIVPKIVTAGVPFTIDHQTTGIRNEKVILGKFVWNFGDGNYKEVLTSDPFEYVYQYGGDYVLTLSFYDSILKDKPDAVDRLNMKVIASGLVVSSIGKADDPFIEIENKSNYEMNLFNFIIKGSNHSFIIPTGTIVLPNKKLKISSKITGFDFNDLNSISIIDKDGQIFATYPSRVSSGLKYQNNQNSGINRVKSEILTNGNSDNSPEIINLNDLGASASNAEGEFVLSKGLYPWLGLAGIIFLGILSVILIRNKRDYPDYVEKEISAKDMTIIE